MGIGELGGTGIADPADELTCFDGSSGNDAVRDSPGKAVVGAGCVVVQVDVPRLPPVVVAEGDRAASIGVHVVLVRPVDEPDGSVRCCDNRRHLWRHEVLSVVDAA